jgi:hypothetical protein
LSKIPVTCRSTAAIVITSSSATPALERPRRLVTNFPLTSGQLVERGITTGTADEPGDHIRIECGLAGCNPAYGIGEKAQVTDLLLEEVTDALRAVGHQVEGIPIFKELREDQNTDRGLRGADLQRRAEPVVGAVRWHLYVGHNYVWTVCAHLLDQLPRILSGRHHLEPTVLEDVNNAFSHDGLIFAHHHMRPFRRIHTATLAFSAEELRKIDGGELSLGYERRGATLSQYRSRNAVDIGGSQDNPDGRAHRGNRGCYRVAVSARQIDVQQHPVWSCASDSSKSILAVGRHIHDLEAAQLKQLTYAVSEM